MTPYIPPNYLVTLDVTPSIVAHSKQDLSDLDLRIAVGFKTNDAKFDVYIDPIVSGDHSDKSFDYANLKLGIEGTVHSQDTVVYAFIEPRDARKAGNDNIAFGGSVMKPVYKGIKFGIEADKYADDNRFLVVGNKVIGKFDIHGGVGASNLANAGNSDQSETNYRPFITESATFHVTKLVSVSLEGKHWITKSANELKASALLAF